MGKFHPHGDQSIYDALVRLAQDFSMRYPLIDGQGNFGNIDGDNAAAMRYIEARMTDVASELLSGITVDFRPTYNEEDEEPVVLPGAFPNLLANDSSGIAVGMAFLFWWWISPVTRRRLDRHRVQRRARIRLQAPRRSREVHRAVASSCILSVLLPHLIMRAGPL